MGSISLSRANKGQANNYDNSIFVFAPLFLIALLASSVSKDLISILLLLAQAPLLVALFSASNSKTFFVKFIAFYLIGSASIGIFSIQLWRGSEYSLNYIDLTRSLYLLLLLCILVVSAFKRKEKEFEFPEVVKKSQLFRNSCGFALVVVGVTVQIIAISKTGLSVLETFRNPELARSNSRYINNSMVTLSSFAIPGMLLLVSKFSRFQELFRYFWMLGFSISFLYLLSGSRFRAVIVMLILILIRNNFIKKYTRNQILFFTSFALVTIPTFGSYRYAARNYSDFSISTLMSGYFGQFATEPYDLARSIDLLGTSNLDYRSSLVHEFYSSLSPFIPFLEENRKMESGGALLVRILNGSNYGGLRIGAMGESLIAFGVSGVLLFSVFFTLLIRIANRNFSKGRIATGFVASICVLNWYWLGIVTLPLWLFLTLMTYILERLAGDSGYRLYKVPNEN